MATRPHEMSVGKVTPVLLIKAFLQRFECFDVSMPSFDEGLGQQSLENYKLVFQNV